MAYNHIRYAETKSTPSVSLLFRSLFITYLFIHYYTRYTIHYTLYVIRNTHYIHVSNFLSITLWVLFIYCKSSMLLARLFIVHVLYLLLCLSPSPVLAIFICTHGYSKQRHYVPLAWLSLLALSHLIIFNFV